MKKPLLLILLICIASSLSFGKGNKERDNNISVVPVATDSILNDSIRKLNDSIRRIHHSIEDIRKDRDFFKIHFVNTLKKDIPTDNEYLSSSFSSINPSKLQDMIEKYKPCRDVADFTEIMNRTDIASSNKKLYEKAVFLISKNGPTYSSELPHKAQNILDSIKEPVSIEQKEEIEELSQIIGLYSDAVTKFQNTIEFIVSQIDREEAKRTVDFKDAMQTQLHTFFDKPRYQNDYNFRISRIPYLDNLYKTWADELNKDILSPKAIEIERLVLSFQTENKSNE